MENPYQAPSALNEPEPEPLPDGLAPRLASTLDGVRLVYYGVVLLPIAFLIAIFMSFFGGAMGIAPLMLLFAASVLLVTLGQLFCLAMPTETRLKPWIIGAVLAHLGTLASLCAPLSTILALSPLISTGLFLGYLIGLARLIGREDLARRGITLFVLCAGLLFALVLLRVLPAQLGESFVYTVVSLILPVAFIFLFILLALLLRALAKSMESIVPTGSEKPKKPTT